VQNSNIEFPILVVLTHIAALILMNSLELTSIILALESIGLCSYVLVGFERNNKFSTSSAVKYLILGTIPGGLLILGVSLLYKNFGTFSKDNLELILSTFIDFSNVNLKNYQTNDFFFYLISLQNSGIQGLDSFVPEILSNNYADNSDIEKFYFDNIYVYNLNDLVLYNTNVEIKETSYVLNNNFDYYLNLSSFLYYKYIFLSTNIAVLFIIINFLFKVTAAPFHAWAPSVYGGAPLPTAAFLSIFSKVALLFLMTTFLLTNFNSLLQV
jgi:NADH:ubiquinone oxidoreductase subunit 2 (subunit N)